MLSKIGCNFTLSKIAKSTGKRIVKYDSGEVNVFDN